MPDELNGTAPAATTSTPAPESPAPPAALPSTETPTEAPRSLDETLRENIDKIWEKNNPPREAGRFAPRTPRDTSPDQPPNAAPEPAAPAIEAPHSWSSEDRTVWSKAPPEVQSIVARREAEAHRRITSMGEQIRSHEQNPVHQVYQQHADYLRQIGRTPEEAARQTFAVSQALDKNPAAAISWLANAYRVNLQQLAAGQQQPSNAPTRDVQLEARVRRMEAEHQQRLTSELETQKRAVIDAIDRFATAKDHPHFEDLQDEIRKLIPGIREDSPHASPEAILQEAYEKARWAHPTVRERTLQELRKAEEEKKRADAEKQAAEAKRQQSLNQRSSRGVTAANGSIQDTLRRNLDRLMSG